MHMNWAMHIESMHMDESCTNLYFHSPFGVASDFVLELMSGGCFFAGRWGFLGTGSGRTQMVCVMATLRLIDASHASQIAVSLTSLGVFEAGWAEQVAWILWDRMMCEVVNQILKFSKALVSSRDFIEAGIPSFNREVYDAPWAF